MSCKCDGIVRYDSVKKKLLYRSGCDWLDVPASALSGEGALPDIDFGDEELPTPPDGDQSQNYACREAYEVMRHLQGLANYGYLQSTKDYTEFVRLTGTPTGIAFKGQVSRYFYDQARKPENAQAFQELTGDDTQRDIFVCQLAEALTKGPGWTTDDDVALYDLIQGMSSIPKLIYTYALHLTDTNELNDIATAAAYDESVPCPCGAASPSAPPPALPDYDGCKVFDFKLSDYGWNIINTTCTYQAGTGFVAQVNKDIGDATITVCEINNDAFDTRKVSSIEVHYTATLGLDEGDWFNTYRKSRIFMGGETLLSKNTEAGSKRLIWYGYKDISQFNVSIIAGVNHDTQGVPGGFAGGSVTITKIIIRYEGTDPAQLSAVPDCPQ